MHTDKETLEEETLLASLNEAELENPTSEEIPDIHSPDWTPFVLSKLTLQEVVGPDKAPRVSGLRRVASMLIGPIVRSESEVISAPQYTGKILTFGDNKKTHQLSVTAVKHTTVFLTGHGETIWTGLATVFHHNTEPEYCLFPLETAASRAEAISLKKALHLSMLTAEERVEKPTEVNAVEDEVEDKATSTQKTLLNTIARQKKVNLNEFILEETDGQFSLENFLDMPKSVAIQLVKNLQS